MNTDTIYICIESEKTCYAIRSGLQSDAENFYWWHLSWHYQHSDKAYFLQAEVPEGYTLIMEVVPRREQFSVNRPTDNTWSVIRSDRLKALEKLLMMSIPHWFGGKARAVARLLIAEGFHFYGSVENYYIKPPTEQEQAGDWSLSYWYDSIDAMCDGALFYKNTEPDEFESSYLKSNYEEVKRLQQLIMGLLRERRSVKFVLDR